MALKNADLLMEANKMSARPKITANGLKIIQAALHLPKGKPLSSEIPDTIIVAIDIENIVNIATGFSKSKDCQAGIAILNTKNLYQSEPSQLISTDNFATGSSSYTAKASRKFLFGKSIVVNSIRVASKD